MAPLASFSPIRSASPASSDSDSLCSVREEKLRKRRMTKHIVERKRRDRINTSLEQLKELILTSLQKDPENYSKMEKADILDMTVEFIKSKCTKNNSAVLPRRPAAVYHHPQPQVPVHPQPQIQHPRLHNNVPSLVRHQASDVMMQSSDVRAAGYQSCRQEVARFLQMTSASPDVKSRLTERLRVDIPRTNSDNLYRKYKHRAACSKGLLTSGDVTPVVSNDLLKVATPAPSTSVWRPF